MCAPQTLDLPQPVRSDGILKGLSFGLLAWFFRVAMSATPQWVTLRVPATTLLYGPATGVAEMFVLGVLFGLTLAPLA